MQSLDIVVKCTGSAYVTNTTRGVRSSCTAGAQQAAELQGRKLFGEQFCRAVYRFQQGGEGNGGPTVWRLFASTEG